jgi:hypothetical protein
MRTFVVALAATSCISLASGAPKVVRVACVQSSGGYSCTSVDTGPAADATATYYEEVPACAADGSQNA